MAADRRLRMRDLAALANASRSRLSNVVTKLEDQGWITRSVATSDRRGAVAELTEAGWGVVVAAAPGHVDMVRTLIFDQLRSDQVSALRSLGEALAGGPLSGAIEPCGDDSGCVPDDTPC
jgi:DNA-binding MarR family transcriptional regulator